MLARLLAFTLLALAAFDAPPPFLDRAGAAALGIGFLAWATPRQPRSLLARLSGRAKEAAAIAGGYAGQTPPSLRPDAVPPLEPFAFERTRERRYPDVAEVSLEEHD